MNLDELSILIKFSSPQPRAPTSTNCIKSSINWIFLAKTNFHKIRLMCLRLMHTHSAKLLALVFVWQLRGGAHLCCRTKLLILPQVLTLTNVMYSTWKVTAYAIYCQRLKKNNFVKREIQRGKEKTREKKGK